MGLFDFLRKPQPQVTLPQICYDVAYFVLPHYAFNDFEKIVDLCTNSPTAAGPFFYLLACQFRKSAPNPEDGRKFQWHMGTLDSEQHYFALEYPVPPPIELSSVPPEKLLSETAPIVLAPYFSAVIRRERTQRERILHLGPGSAWRRHNPALRGARRQKLQSRAWPESGLGRFPRCRSAMGNR